MDQLILDSVGSYIEGRNVGALMSNGLPDLLEDTTDLSDIDIEFIQSMSDVDKQTFALQVGWHEVELSQEQKDNLYVKGIKRYI